jgi:hypothetical protein
MIKAFFELFKELDTPKRKPIEKKIRLVHVDELLNQPSDGRWESLHALLSLMSNKDVHDVACYMYTGRGDFSSLDIARKHLDKDFYMRERIADKVEVLEEYLEKGMQIAAR